jgi:hypothetical protein
MKNVLMHSPVVFHYELLAKQILLKGDEATGSLFVLNICYSLPDTSKPKQA